MSDLICEIIARKAGFLVSVGNWISPTGQLISGWDYNSHHWETLIQYWNDVIPKEYILFQNNHLQCMHEAVNNGFIRLVFRIDVLFQVGTNNIEDLWSDLPNYRKMISVLQNIDCDVHVFSNYFYVIGTSYDIVSQKMDKLQIKIQ